MTTVHALMATFWFDLHATLSATIFHEFFDAVEATTSRMTYFLALVAALELILADLATVWRALVAENVGHELFAAIAKTSHQLKTRRTVACVAFH
jgi:alpha-ketoglutarate-dependent taurine dioxygenase